MAVIDNMPQDSRVYHEGQFNSKNLSEGTSGMASDIESNYTKLQSAAISTLKKRKKTYDYKTKNKSFLRLYDTYYKMGIKNNRFMLAIYDTDLIGVDVYSPIMPKDLQLKIILECMINPWYFLREVCRIPTDGTPLEPGGGVPFIADRNNIASWYLFINGIDHYVSKSRQRGKTQGCISEFNYAFHFGCISSKQLFFNKDKPQAAENLGRLKDQRDLLPKWMQMRSIVDENGKIDTGTDNILSYKSPVTNNKIMVMPKAVSKEAATKLGRGSTAALQYYDELDFTPYFNEIIGAASFAYSTAADNAKKHGNLYGRIFSSTPGDLDTRDGAEAAKFVSRMLKWEDKFLDEPINKLSKILHSPSYNKIVFVEHSWQQLGLSIEWYENQCALVDYDQIKIMREINLKRIHGSNQSPFKQSDLMYLINHVKDPVQSIDISKNLCPFKIYDTIKPSKVYILSIDPAEGLGGDNNAATLINPLNQKPVMEFRSPYVSQTDFGKMLIQFLDRFCPRSLIVIENNKGRELINFFRNTKYVHNLYYNDNKDFKAPVDKINEYGDIVKSAYESRAIGLNTSRSNRPVYYAILENVMYENKDLLYTEYLVDDVCGLIKKPTGRVEAGSGKHDDNIMSYLMGLYVLNNSTAEFLERFGIYKGMPEEEDSLLYDENGNLNEVGQLQRLRELAMSGELPEELQDIINQTLNQKTEIDDLWQHKKEVAMASQTMFEDDNTFRNTPAPIDEAFWVNYDNQIIESNFVQDNIFDIDDYLE